MTRRPARFAALAVLLAVPASLLVAAPASAATVTVTAWSDLQSALTVDGDVVVLGSATTAFPVTSGEQLSIPGGVSVVLDLAGHTLSITDPGFGNAAIHVPPTASLTIRATGGGTLEVQGSSLDYSGAGIGGEGDDGAAGQVVIEGGTIVATGGTFGAGIGGSEGGDGGAVTITGGVVTATGGGASGFGAAGIGSGDTGSSAGSLLVAGEPEAGAATTGGAGFSSIAPTIVNPATPPAGVGYDAVTTTVGGGGQIVVTFHYRVTFDSGGGSAVPTQTVDYGDPALEPADPVRTGYAFAGWRLSSLSYDFGTPVREPITLTAAWVPVLAATGVDATPVLLAGLVLVLLGALAVVVTVRRRATSNRS